MPKRISQLSTMVVERAKPREKRYKLSDGYGLHLLVTIAGGKLLRFQYRFGNKQRSISFGSYPEISISCALKSRDEARQRLANGIDPGSVKKELKMQEQVQAEINANTFEKVARDWHGYKKYQWTENQLIVSCVALKLIYSS